MPKALLISLITIGAVAVIGGGGWLLINNFQTTNSPTTNSSNTQSKITLDDPSGDYDFFSDPSITKYPEANIVFGNGQTFTVEYDGSKTNHDSNATLSYYLYCIQDDGKVQPMGGGTMVGEGEGTFSNANSVFNSLAKDRNGFFEVVATATGQNTQLGMYPIKFEISE